MKRDWAEHLSVPVRRSYLTHQLCVDLGDTVDGARSLHTQVRGGVSGWRWAEGADSAWDKHTQTVFGGDV